MVMKAHRTLMRHASRKHRGRSNMCLSDFAFLEALLLHKGPQPESANWPGESILTAGR